MQKRRLLEKNIKSLLYKKFVLFSELTKSSTMGQLLIVIDYVIFIISGQLIWDMSCDTKYFPYISFFIPIYFFGLKVFLYVIGVKVFLFAIQDYYLPCAIFHPYRSNRFLVITRHPNIQTLPFLICMEWHASKIK